MVRPTSVPSAENAPPGAWGLWDCRRPLSRQAYLVIGVLLMLVKYAVEFTAIDQLTGELFTFLDFLNPLLTARQRFLRGAPEWFGMAWLIWTLPFVVLAVLLSVRRAIDADWSPWLGLLILVPFVNFLVMILLAYAPSATERGLVEQPADAPLSAPADPTQVHAAILGVIFAAFYSLIAALVCIYLFDSYGAALFFGIPLVAGAVASYDYNVRSSRSWASTMGVAILPMLIVGGLFLLFALEGIICIAMAAPIAIPPAIVGGVIGKGIADYQRHGRAGRGQLVGCLAVLPIVAFGESRLPRQAEFVVVTSVDVAAPPEVVWRNVVDFPPIDSPAPWLFRLGISGPQAARIEGRGVGATRYCDFTTGSFVEPITAWDEPRRLAFDVTEQPEPMFELSPFRHIHPPHLHGAFRSTRGEFVLEPLADGGTRLTGRTWYQLELAPHGYWTAWTDWIIHRIHERVLEHIKDLSETALQ